MAVHAMDLAARLTAAKVGMQKWVDSFVGRLYPSTGKIRKAI